MVRSLLKSSLLLLSVYCYLQTVQSYYYDNSVYDLLLRYAFISKISYCIDYLKEDHDLATPIVLKPKPYMFLQNGFDRSDYYGPFDAGVYNEENETDSGDENDDIIDLHVAKMLYNHNTVNSASGTSDTKKTSAGFFAVDHRRNGTIILALRGTVNTRDYMTDVNIATSKYVPLHEEARDKLGDCDNCKVHKGFYERYKELSPEIFPTIETLVKNFPDYKLVITGHSLGGAIGVLIGLELALLDYTPLVIAYGCPKVANIQLANFIDQLFLTEELLDENVMEKDGLVASGLIRVVHKGDYVPLLPPGGAFYQAGVEFFIESDELPHPKSSVHFNGLAKNLSHPFDFNFGDLFSFDPYRMLHHKQHTEYFYTLRAECEDIHDSYVQSSDESYNDDDGYADQEDGDGDEYVDYNHLDNAEDEEDSSYEIYDHVIEENGD